MWLAALVSISLATPLHLLVAAETPSNVDNLNELRWTEGKCDFGTVPGYWWAGRYKSFSKACKFKRLVEQHSPRALKKRTNTASAEDMTHILFIGDSLDRNIVIALSEWSGQPYQDYTPMRWLPDGRPQKIGRSCMVTFANHTYANLFIFAANNEKKYFSIWKEGQVAGMSDNTFDRVCHDGPKYLPYFPASSPYLISLNSAYWEVGRWERYFGRNGKDIISLTSPEHEGRSINQVYQSYNSSLPLRKGELPTYDHASSVRLGTPIFKGMVIRHPQKSEEPDYMKELLWDFRREMEALMEKVEQCYPNTKIYCWRTAPRVATDDRIHHFFHKRPHIMSALNQLARYTARKRGWCILDLDQMLQAHGNNEEFVPDGAHPAAWVNLEYANIVLNVIREHKLRAAEAGDSEHSEDSEDPELNEILRKAIKGEEAYREHLPHEESEQ